jgi:hypothetical protein
MNPADVKAALERQTKHKAAVDAGEPDESPYYLCDYALSPSYCINSDVMNADNALLDYAIAMQPVMVKMLDVCRAMLPWVEREVYYRDQEAKKHLPVLATAIAEAEKLVPEEVSRGS